MLIDSRYHSYNLQNWRWKNWVFCLKSCRFFEEESSSFAENTTDGCLNHRQEEAKKFILGAKDSVPFRQGPSLIIGPFGTGKTLTLAKIVEDLLQQDESSKLLICTHSDRYSFLFTIKNYFRLCVSISQRLDFSSKDFELLPRVTFTLCLFVCHSVCMDVGLLLTIRKSSQRSFMGHCSQ